MAKRATKAKKRKPSGWLGWHFSDETEKLKYGDGRKIKVGATHTVNGTPVLCSHGLHASKTVRDALKYAGGSILFRVRLSGKIAHDDDKSCATKRTYLARIDAEPILREFARKCALKVIHLWDAPRVVKEYLETGDEKLRRAARGAAANAAASAAAESAAESAARAANAAANAAASAAARRAARAQTKMLDEMVLAALAKQKREGVRRAAISKGGGE